MWPFDGLLSYFGYGSQDEDDKDKKKDKSKDKSKPPVDVSFVGKAGTKEAYKTPLLKPKDAVWSKQLLDPPPSSPSPHEIDQFVHQYPRGGTRIDSVPRPDPVRVAAPTEDKPKDKEKDDKGSISTKVNFLPVTLAGKSREGQLLPLTENDPQQKRRGDSYAVKAGRVTYSNSVTGSGKDDSYKIGGGESISGQFLHAKGKRERTYGNLVKAGLSTEAQAGGVEAGYEGYGKADSDGLSAALGGSFGAYSVKGSLGAQLGFRIPYTNIQIGGGFKGEAGIGYGASGAIGGEISAKRGVRLTASGKAASGAGVGGKLSFGVSKFDPKAGWLEVPKPKPSTDEEFLAKLPPPGTPNRWKGVPPDVKERLRKQTSQGRRAKKKKR